MKKEHILVLLALFSLLVLPAAAPMPAGASDLQETTCMVDLPPGLVAGQDVLCYYLTVPSRYDDPQGKTIRLAVIVIKASDFAPHPDPIFFAQGGPGGSTIDFYTSYLFGNHRLSRSRDFVLLEQRGTLHSEPALYCQEFDEYTLETLNLILEDEEAERRSQDALLACAERLRADDISLADFNSIENARDIESLRLALGYEAINLYGVSYGTLLAQHYMRLYPDSLRSVVLDGVVPTDVNLFVGLIQNEDRAFRYFFDSCQADPVCNQHYPDLEKVFYDTVRKMDENPVSVKIRDLDTDIEHPAMLDGQSLYGSVFQMLYDQTLARLLPRIIYDAQRGNFEIISKVLSFFVFDRTMSYGMYYSVMCAEDGYFDPQDVDYSGVQPEIIEFNQDNPELILQACADWNVPLLPDAEVNLPVRSDVPTLLLSGGFDPVTPESYARIVAGNLSNAYEVTFPWGAHGQLFDNACSDYIIQDFWDAPSRKPDTACLADYQSPAFFAPRDLIILPVTFSLLRLEDGALAGAFGVLALLLVLGSAWFVLPLVWFVKLFRANNTESPAPGCLLRLASPLALLNGAILTAFLVGYVAVVIGYLDGDSQLLLFFGLPGEMRPLFILPLLSLALTFGMAALSITGWFSETWHILRKLYYSLLVLSAVLTLVLLAVGGMLFGLFA
jgi:pimeloyl-ACP methyl ester carboxylesterase